MLVAVYGGKRQMQMGKREKRNGWNGKWEVDVGHIIRTHLFAHGDDLVWANIT